MVESVFNRRNISESWKGIVTPFVHGIIGLYIVIALIHFKSRDLMSAQFISTDQSQSLSFSLPYSVLGCGKSGAAVKVTNDRIINRSVHA